MKLIYLSDHTKITPRQLYSDSSAAQDNDWLVKPLLKGKRFIIPTDAKMCGL